MESGSDKQRSLCLKTVDDLVTQRDEWVLTQEALYKLLSRLDPDIELAGQKYEQIRRSLIIFFQHRGCLTPEEQVDETIDRVARRLSEGAEIYTDNPFLYFYGVALNVFHEYQRKQPPPSALPILTDSSESERRFKCMNRCLQKLPAETRLMLTEYSQGDHHARTENRKRMAKQMGISLNTLRIRVHRLREQLGLCVKKCLKQEAE